MALKELVYLGMEEILIDGLNKIDITTQADNTHYITLVMPNEIYASGLYLLLKDEKIEVKFKYTEGLPIFQLVFRLLITNKQFEKPVTLDNRRAEWMTWLDGNKVTELWVCVQDKNNKVSLYAQPILL